MSPIAALRSRRSLDGLPTASTDDELLAWSEALVRAPSQGHRPPRTSPLRADRRRAKVTLDEILTEIEQRARSVSR